MPAEVRRPLVASDAGVVSTCDLTKMVAIQSAPFSLNDLVINVRFFVMTLLLARLGSDTLAATGLVSAVQLLTIAPVKGLLVSTNVVASRHANNKPYMGVVLQQSLLLSFVASLCVSPFYLASVPFFRLLGQERDIAEMAGYYLQRFYFSVPAVLFLRSIEMFTVAIKRPHLALLMNSINTLLMVGLTDLFALGHGGAPKWGLGGAAYAASFSSWFSLLFMTLYFRFSGDFSEYQLFTWTPSPRKAMFGQLIWLGLPIAIQMGMDFLCHFVQSMLMGKLGRHRLSANQIVTQYAGLILSPVSAIATISAGMVSRDITQHGARHVKKIGWLNMAAALLFSAVGLFLFPFAYKPLTDLFLDATEASYKHIAALTRGLFLISAVNMVLDAARQASVGALQGLGDTAIPAVIILGWLWAVGVPSAYGLAFPLGLDIWGLYMGRGISLLISTPLLLRRWHESSQHIQEALSNANQPFKTQWQAFFSGCCSNGQPPDAVFGT